MFNSNKFVSCLFKLACVLAMIAYSTHTLEEVGKCNLTAVVTVTGSGANFDKIQNEFAVEGVFSVLNRDFDPATCRFDSLMSSISFKCVANYNIQVVETVSDVPITVGSFVDTEKDVAGIILGDVTKDMVECVSKNEGTGPNFKEVTENCPILWPVITEANTSFSGHLMLANPSSKRNDDKFSIVKMLFPVVVFDQRRRSRILV